MNMSYITYLINYQINKILKPSYLFYAKLNEWKKRMFEKAPN